MHGELFYPIEHNSRKPLLLSKDLQLIPVKALG